MSDDTTTAPETTAPAPVAPTAKPAPVAPAAPAAPAAETHAEPADHGPVKYGRFAEVNRQRQEAEAARAAAEARAAEMESRIAELSTKALRAERALVYREYSDRPNLQAPEVRDFVEGQYKAYAEREADAAKPFATWMSEHAPTSPLLAPYFAAPAGTTGPATQPPPPSTDRGVKGATSPPAVELLSYDQIQQRKRAGKWGAEEAKQLAKAMGFAVKD